VGAHNSSNANRLVEVAVRAGTSAHLIGDARDIRSEWLNGCRSVGLTAGASTPQVLIDEVTAWLRVRGCERVEEVKVAFEDVHFTLPGAGNWAQPCP
jgi:4-hydroxy-3-methylbut-2-enyl diphosphate reductase